MFFRRFFRLSANFRPYSSAIFHPNTHIIFCCPLSAYDKWWFEQKKITTFSGKVFRSELPLTLSQPGGAHCAPPQVHFLKYLRNALSYGLETFWQFKWIKLNNKNLFFNRLRPPLVTIATFKVDACFWKAHFGSFHAKAYQNSMFFATPMKNGRPVVCCENLD